MSAPADVLDMAAKSDPKVAERLRKAQMAQNGHSTRFTTVWADEIELRLDQPHVWRLMVQERDPSRRPQGRDGTDGR
jgi:hypothetical protein